MMANYITTYQRMISNTGYSSKIFCALSGEVVQRIRRICLSMLRQDEKQTRLVLNQKEIDQSIRESVVVVRPQFWDRPDLFKKIEGVLRKYLLSKTAVVVRDPQDLERTGSFYDNRLEKWAQSAYTKMILYLDNEEGMEPIQIAEEYQKISCFQYALLNIGVLIQEEFTENCFHKTLQNQFQNVLQPQDGDLVLFLDNQSITHAGVWQDGEVLSKEGNYMPVAYLRPLEDFTAGYGDRVQYFRKITYSDLKQD